MDKTLIRYHKAFQAVGFNDKSLRNSPCENCGLRAPTVTEDRQIIAYYTNQYKIFALRKIEHEEPLTGDRQI